MTDRIEEFSVEGRNFVYYDLSNFKQLKEYEMLIENAKLGIVKYPLHSLLSITNIANVQFDTSVKEAVARWMIFNKPYVKCGAAIGASGIKTMVVNAILSTSQRSNMKMLRTKDQAIEWLLKQ